MRAETIYSKFRRGIMRTDADFVLRELSKEVKPKVIIRSRAYFVRGLDVDFDLWGLDINILSEQSPYRKILSRTTRNKRWWG